MFNKDFFPTPQETIVEMLSTIQLNGAKVLEPHVGSGNIVKYCQNMGADVIGCEIDNTLIKIAEKCCPIIERNFFDVQSHQISHIDFIIMNPPFSDDDGHILHAWNIAPEGCHIISLCNSNTLDNCYIRKRLEVAQIIKNYGYSKKLGKCFIDAERTTNVEISVVHLFKPKSDKSYEFEFDGYFIDEEEETQSYGMNKYNYVRDMVNRYVELIKLFDKQLEIANQMSAFASGYFHSKESLMVKDTDTKAVRLRYIKDLQKSGWINIFEKLKLNKLMNEELKKELNQFIEERSNYPFTMKNIFGMLDMIIQTHGERINKIVLKSFDYLTQYYHDNRYYVEGWKTNSHYMVNRKFILPDFVEMDYKKDISVKYNSNDRFMDFMKGLCHVTGINSDTLIDLKNFYSYQYSVKTKEFEKFFHDERDMKIFTNRLEKDRPDLEYDVLKIKRQFGEWYNWNDIFRVKGFKKGSMHFEFINQDVWYLFNQKVAELKGLVLPEKI